MQILNEGTLRNYDKFRDNIFVHKKNQFKKEIPKKQVKLPFPFLRNSILLGAVCYGIYEYRQTIDRVFNINALTAQLKTNLLPLNHQTVIWTILQQLSTRFSIKRLLHYEKLAPFDNKFANATYITQIQTLLYKLQQRQNANQVYAKTNSSLKFWIWELNKVSQRIFINQLGDLVEVHYLSPLSFAGVGILGNFSKKFKLLKLSSDYARIKELQNRDKIDNINNPEFNFAAGCNAVNKLNSLYTTTAQNQFLINDCKQQVSKIQHNLIRQYQLREKKYKAYQKAY